MSEHPKLPRTNEVDVLILIPTVATPQVLLPSFRRLLDHLDGLRVHIVAAINPKDQEHGDHSAAELRRIFSEVRPDDAFLTIYQHPEPCGFGGAINRALRAGTDTQPATESKLTSYSIGTPWGLPERGMTVIWNDDLRVTDGWLLGMLYGLRTPQVRVLAEVPTENGQRPRRSVGGYGRVGMVGPMTNVAAGIQVINPEHHQTYREMGLDRFADWWREQNTINGEPVIYTASFLSGYCQGYLSDMVDDLLFIDDNGDTCLFDERYLIAGYEDNDLCARAEEAGWSAVVAYDTFIGHLGHQTFDELFPDMSRGMRNRLTYYNVWKDRLKKVDNKLVAVFRVRLDVPNDVALFRTAIVGAARLVDGIAILLTGPLASIRQSEEFQESLATQRVDGDAQRLAMLDPHQEVEGLRNWAVEWSKHVSGSRHPEIRVERWHGQFNERDERNHVLAMAYGMDADWVMSIDHDEVLEPRVTRDLIERLFRHPDPLIREWDFSWINHWESNRLMNVSRPWGDGGTYLGGMHGYRLFRVNKAAPKWIQAGGNNGLHCGNIPMSGPVAKRISGMRFRHFGYMRFADRVRKQARYDIQDPNPNPGLVGGTSYAHITNGENQLMTEFAPVNGIGIHALMYEKETADNLGRNLDQLYGLADRIVLVWTGAWSKADRRRLYGEEKIRHEGNRRGTYRPQVDLWSVEDWPETGPSREVAQMAEHFGAEWVYQPLNDHIAEARNAGIDALHGTPGLGWGYFFDPDEHTPINAPVGFRRQAEVTNAWGWLYQFANLYEGGTRHNMSESVRMHRLDSRGIMRMNGRVHESFDEAVRGLVAEGYGQVLRMAPQEMTMTNTGLNGDPEAMQAKLERYRRLCEMELADNPNNPTAWTTLGLFWTNEGNADAALECFARGMVTATEGQYLPFREAGYEYMRRALVCLQEAVGRMGGHPQVKILSAMIDFLQSAAIETPVLGKPGELQMTNEQAIASLPPLGTAEIAVSGS